MTKRVDRLTPEQEAQMIPFAQTWIERGLRTTPLTEDEWKVWEEGARKCYEFAGIPFPAHNIVRVSSPLAGAFAAPIAAWWIGELGKSRGSVLDSVGGSVGGSVRGSVRDSVRGSVLGSVLGSVRGSVGDSVLDSVRDSVGGSVRGSVGGSVGDSVGGSVLGSVRDSVGGSVGDSVGDSNWSELKKFITNNWNKFLGGRIGGYYYTSIEWEAYIAYFRDIAGLELDDDMWERSRALEDADSAGWWWPYKDFIMVCDTPTVIHQEQVAPIGWGSHRLHCETGPAVAWADGYSIYAWHGTRVPAWVIEAPTVALAMQEGNSEIRRAALESIGWDEAISELESRFGAKLLGTCPDPGNAPHELALYSIPEQIYDEPVNLVLMVNGSPDRDGKLRRYGETVPSTITDALAAAAWQYDVTPDVYAQLARRT